ncbi:MAG: hypothetical protein DIZ80_13350 [endosymbiont of Galathealinum brachiosum]|uniref:NarX-like N-terminal domain-containing protein n=1 Tax=endosymbiont of Galathealinum brachiosum TaxID=2200906 RepID=A0A370D866_9GAMM|nr:MAG: hypothetical protein DIZ80_13350 [endosymbiont of Galathealinum brachiosum]
MSKLYKFLSSFILLFCLLLPTNSSAEISSLSSAINKAGRQRMLSQRIVATYSQVGQQIQTKKSRKQLKNAIILFDQQLNELKKYQPIGSINKQLKKVDVLWQPMRLIALAPVNRSKAEELREHAEDVLRASHRVVIMLQDKYGSRLGELVNISGRQRMLSQRMSNLYMLQSWGFSSSEYTGDYSRALNEFKGALSELNNSSLNSSQINKKLNKVRKEFAMLERSNHKANGEYIPLMIKMSTDKLLIIMNDITMLYEQLE